MNTTLLQYLRDENTLFPLIINLLTFIFILLVSMIILIFMVKVEVFYLIKI
jgi:hypothetical protein